MTHTIRNLTPSPMDLPGGRVLPAFGEVTMELTPLDAIVLGHSLAITVSPVEDDDPLEPFRAEYERLTGKRADRRWSEDRLFSEIEKADA